MGGRSLLLTVSGHGRLWFRWRQSAPDARIITHGRGIALPLAAEPLEHRTSLCSLGEPGLLARLTTPAHAGIFANMIATLIHAFKDVGDDGSIIEMVVWRVPEPVPPTTHGLKHRLVYIVDGKRVIGFDNERGKGDHRHLDDVEQPYCFTTLERLIEDFIAEVEKRRTS